MENQKLLNYSKKIEAGYITRLASPIKPLFKNGRFNNENWNSGAAYGFREFAFEDLKYCKDEGKILAKQTNRTIVKVTRELYLSNQTWYSTIHVFAKSDKDVRNYKVHSTIYKERGKVESIDIDGKPISEEMFVQLLNDIETSGYEIWEIP